MEKILFILLAIMGLVGIGVLGTVVIGQNVDVLPENGRLWGGGGGCGMMDDDEWSSMHEECEEHMEDHCDEMDWEECEETHEECEEDLHEYCDHNEIGIKGRFLNNPLL